MRKRHIKKILKEEYLLEKRERTTGPGFAAAAGASAGAAAA